MHNNVLICLDFLVKDHACLSETIVDSIIW